MPLYEYECDACRQRFEVIQKFSDPPPTACRACGKGPVRRLASSPAIQFKGSGWYITDYAQKEKKSKSDEGATSKGSSSSDSATTTGSGTTGDASATSSPPAPASTKDSTKEKP